jgi:Icc-related predicted phosphoesterase
MKIACISDTHGLFLPEIPEDCDYVIHAGDVGPDRNCSDWLKGPFSEWASKHKKLTFMTWGNHDFIGERMKKQIIQQEFLPHNVLLCVDEWCWVGNKKVWFSPWSNQFGDWAFMAPEDKLAQLYAVIPDDVDIIVSHGPPLGYGDFTYYYWHQNVGSQSLIGRFSGLKKCSHIICGHIHEAKGTYKVDDSKTVVNCSQVDLQYQPLVGAVPVIEFS